MYCWLRQTWGGTPIKVNSTHVSSITMSIHYTKCTVDYGKLGVRGTPINVNSTHVSSITMCIHYTKCTVDCGNLELALSWKVFVAIYLPVKYLLTRDEWPLSPPFSEPSESIPTKRRNATSAQMFCSVAISPAHLGQLGVKFTICEVFAAINLLVGFVCQELLHPLYGADRSTFALGYRTNVQLILQLWGLCTINGLFLFAIMGCCLYRTRSQNAVAIILKQEWTQLYSIRVIHLLPLFVFHWWQKGPFRNSDLSIAWRILRI
jgi:hypothetical protein